MPLPFYLYTAISDRQWVNMFIVVWTVGVHSAM